jgi:5-methylcytosine-specific restriction endonuclease McrA
MKKHTKIYLQYFGLTIADFVSCEVCQSKAVDIHHIEARGMGGSKSKDEIENLMALCRNCHEKFGDKKQYMKYLKDIHLKKIINTVY